MALTSLDDSRLAAISYLAAQPHKTRQQMITHAQEGNPRGWSPELVELLRAIGTVCRTPHDWQQLRRELIERRRPSKPQAAPRQSATTTRPRGARSPRRGGAKTAQDPGEDGDGDPDADPVERRILELVNAAPPLSEGQRRRLVVLLGGSR